MISAHGTHPGLVRQNNEDCLRTDDDLGIYLLADGIGGHNAGEVASALAVATVYSVLRSNIAHTAIDDYSELMMHAMHAAHWEISTKARINPEMKNMGTTLVAVVVRDDRAYIVNAGDSRCYRFQARRQPDHGSPATGESSAFIRVTHDHTMGDQMLAKGIAIDQIPRKYFHMLTRSIGCENPPDPDFYVVDVGRDDMLLICSDGLTDMLTDVEISAILASGTDLDAMTRELIDAANANGGRDNISVVLVACGM